MYYENFEKLCNANGIRPSKVSKETGISTATLTSWKQGKYTPKQDKLQLIADYFNVSVDYLMTGKDSRYSDENADLIADIMMDNDLLEVMKLYQKLKKEQQKHVVDLMIMLDKKGE